jgi:hypothetical protein
MHDKKSLLEALMNNADFQAFGLEEIIIRDCLISEKWISSSNAEKQDQRRKFLALCQRRKGGINVVYYENMIVAYDCMLKFLNSINSLYEDKRNMKNSILLQRIITLLITIVRAVFCASN